MKQFNDKNFVLDNEVAQDLFHNHAAKMPIIDYHCHLIPEMVANDHRFKSITELWLGGDHYKWRAMRTNGVDERYCTGKDTSDWEKFEKWAETVPYTLRNPLYHWTHLELKTAFGIEKLLSPKTAREIFDECNEKLKQPEFSARGLMKHYHVECRVKGNTISYRHPNYTDKSGKLVSVRGSKLGDKYTVKGINYELGKNQRGREADRAEVLTADSTRTADRIQTANGGLYTGTDDKRSGAFPQGVRTITQGTETGGSSNGISETAQTGNTASGTERNRNESSGNGGGNRSILGGRSEGREGSSSGDGNAKDVPTFEELFDSYKRRNTKVVRTSDAESEPARAVRKKRQDRGL